MFKGKEKVYICVRGWGNDGCEIYVAKEEGNPLLYKEETREREKGIEKIGRRYQEGHCKLTMGNYVYVKREKIEK